MIKHFLFMLSLLLPVSALAEDARPANGGDKLSIVASFSILGDMAQKIGGEAVSVKTLAGAGQNPHDYTPVPQDVAALQAADVVFINGRGLEAWLPRLLASAGAEKKSMALVDGLPMLLAEEAAETEHEHEHAREDDHHGEHAHDAARGDPHGWATPEGGKHYIAKIEAALSAARPEKAALFRANAAQLVAALSDLDAEIEAKLAAVPQAERVVVTSHDAFGHFARAYDIRFIAAQGVLPMDSISAQDFATVIEAVKKTKARVYFIENALDARLTEQLAAAAGLRFGGKLYPDALSAAAEPAADYVSLLQHNARSIIGALSAQADQTGR